MSVERVIAGGQVVTPTGVFDADVAIDGDEIVAVGERETLPEAETETDASGLVVMPGVVDPHVHIDETPSNRAGTYRSETSAAALGGVTTVLDFAFQGGNRALSDDSAGLVDGIAHKRQKGRAALVDFGLHGVVHRETEDSLDELAEAVDAGVTSFKLFMSNYEVGVSNGFISQAVERIAALDAVAAFHTEDPSVCQALTERLKREGRSDPTDYPESRPDYVEAMAAEDAIRMALEAGAKYYEVHTTCRKAAETIDRFQTDGSRVRAETCTHYTALDESAYEEFGNLARLAPPLRAEDDVGAIFEYLADDTLSVVSTDHAVHHRDRKEVENWWDSPLGVNSIQVSLPIFHEKAVNERGFSYPFLVRAMSTNPARTFGLPRKGDLRPGTDADIVLFDPNEEYTITAADNASNSTYSIYEGTTVTGRVKKTFVRGTPVADDGVVVGDPGDGQYVARELPDWTR